MPFGQSREGQLPRETMMETLKEKIARVVREEVAVVPYDPRWPAMFEQERRHLRSALPRDLVRRIEHFGSTAVPGLSAKPIVDILVEVTSLDETRIRIAPILEAQGYEYFWRASRGEDTPPFYAWFIKRDSQGNRTHHIHMVEAGFEHWERLLFRDYLIEHPEVAREYSLLKERLSDAHRRDRVAYTEAKETFVRTITERAKEYYRSAGKAGKTVGGKPMQNRGLFTDVAVTFVVTLVVTIIVTLLWNLIAHGDATIDWPTAFRLAIILAIALPIVNRAGKRGKRP